MAFFKKNDYSEYSKYWEFSDKVLFGNGGVFHNSEFFEYFELSELTDSIKKIIMLSEYSEYWEFSDKDLFGNDGNIGIIWE